MNTIQQVLLADDDIDDCMFFKEALKELSLKAQLTTVNDGEALMQLLTSDAPHLPDTLFLDLNMPRKTGMECLSEIKINIKLKHLPVIIFSTSFDYDVVNSLYEKGAHYYIRKPGEFSQLKKVILEALTMTAEKNSRQPARDKFVIQP